MRPRLLPAALLLMAGTLPAAAQDAPAGIIRGTVYDREFSTPITGARVSVLGLPLAVLSSVDGTFLLRSVPVGAWTLTIVKDGYETLLLTDVAVAPAGFSDVRADLAAEVLDLEEMVVTGADALLDSEVGLLDLRAAAVSVQDAVSSELIGKAGVSDAAGALKLVVGASVQGGKYATVRGLSDRYTGTTLNGVRIPSADPRRRAVQLDLFPTGTLEGVTVTKSFTPDLQGDFTGGGIDIRTKSIPDAPVLSLSTSFEFNSLATGDGGFLTYDGGGVDGLAYHGGDRDLPSEATDPLPAFPLFRDSYTEQTQPYQDSQAYDRVVRSFDPVMGVSESAPGLNSGFSLVAGDRYEFGDGRVLGVMSGLSYSRKFDSYEQGLSNSGGVSDPSQPVLSRSRTDSRGMEEVLIGALANVVLKPGEDHELALRVIANQSAEDEARFQVEDQGAGTVEQNQSLHYTERSLVSFQLHGSHAPQGDRSPRIDWMASSNRTYQDEPDVRFFRNRYYFSSPTNLSADFIFPNGTTAQQNTRRIFREIDEENLQAAVHVTLPFGLGQGLEGYVKSGLYTDRTDRGYLQRSYYYEFSSQFGRFNPKYPQAPITENVSYATFKTTDPGLLWTDVFLESRRIGLASNDPAAPNQLLWTLKPFGDDVDYDGEQSIGALYTMAEAPLRHDLKVVGGVRRETSRLEIAPRPTLRALLPVIKVQEGSGDRAIEDAAPEEASAAIRETRYLPALAFVWEPAIRMNVRFSWGRTLARPTFRELAPVVTEEFIFGDEFIGNPDLTLSRITNYDLRWEWFRRTGDVLAASLFYKELRDPIEYISFSASGRSFIQPVNYEKGSLRGIEVEARLGLDLFSERLRNFAVGVNATWLDSEVEVPAAEQASLRDFGLAEAERRLQGQPEYVYNLNVTWDDDARGIAAAIFYNRVGETLLTGAARGTTDGIPNVFDTAYGTLDVTASKRLTRHLSIGVKARNLLGAARTSVYRKPDGDEAIKSERDTASLYALTGSFRW